MGRSAGVKPTTRSGAQPGDLILVTGPLGGSMKGRHLTFEPRIHLAREISKTGEVTSMIDLSDGLSRDIRHICRMSGVGARIDLMHLPIHDDIYDIQREDWRTFDHALHDGEDYELLFTATTWTGEQPEAWPVGEITEGSDILVNDRNGLHPLVPKGWEHAF